MADNIVRRARLKSGLSASEFALALGYASPSKHHLRQQVYDMEAQRKPISTTIALLSWMYLTFGVPRQIVGRVRVANKKRRPPRQKST